MSGRPAAGRAVTTTRRHRRGPGRADRRRAAGRGGARVLVWPRASARRTSRPARSTCSATRPTGSTRPREALARLHRRRTPTTPTRRARRGGDRAASTGSSASWPPAATVRGGLDENILLPTAVGALAPVGARARDDGGGRPAPRRPDASIVGLRALQRLPPRATWPTTCARAGRRRRARSSSTVAVDGRPDANALGARARRSTTPSVRAPRSSRELAARLTVAASGSASRPRSGSRDRARRSGASCRSGSGGPVFEIPTLPPSVPGMRVDRTLRARAAAAGGRVVLGLGRSSARSATAAASRRSARHAAGREIELPRRWIVLATGGFAASGVDHARLPLARARDGARPAARRRPGGGRGALRPDYFGDAAVGARRASRSTTGLRPVDADGARVLEQRARRRRDLAGAQPWQEKSGDGISLASGLPRRGDELDHRRRQHDVDDDVLFELMRGSLDHCVKCTICETHCPFSNVTPLFPGPKYVGPQAERFRTGEAVRRRLGRLLLELRHLHAGLPAGRPHRGDQHAGAKARSARAEGVPLRDQLHRAARRARPARHARRAARELDAGATGRCGCSIEKALGIHRDAALPKFAGRRSSAGPSAHRAAGGERSAVVYFHGCGANYYEPDVGEKTVAVLEHNGFAVDVPKQDCCGLPLQSNGIFDDARGYVAAPGEAPRAARARGHDDRRRPRRAAR